MKVERVRQVYTEIERYTITLSADPGALGPKYLQDQIATCRDYINNVSRILMEVHREKHNLAAEIHTSETALNVESDNLRATDERIRNLPHDKDRAAAVNLLLRVRVQALADLRAQLQDLDYMEKAVRHRHRELRDTMAEIKLQRSLIRDEIDTKSFYGGERDTTEPNPDDDLDGADLDAMLGSVHQERADARARILSENAEVETETGRVCSLCGEAQFHTPSGWVCASGHGGVPSATPEQIEAFKDLAAMEDSVPPPPPTALPEPPAAEPEILSGDLDAAMDSFLAEGDHEGAPKSNIIADDFADILDNV
jgi:hypothetical protein